MLYLTKRRKIIIGIIVIVVILSASKSLLSKHEEAPVFIEAEETITARAEQETGQDTEEIKNEEVYVDIKGAVVHPGVYKLVMGDRVQDAVEKAGGTTEEADLLKVNLAEKVYDEMKIVIPVRGEEIEADQAGTGNGKISINRATSEQLTQLEGIGPSKAKAIIQYRTENGNFNSIDEIMNVSGIGPATFEKIKDEITVR